MLPATVRGCSMTAVGRPRLNGGAIRTDPGGASVVALTTLGSLGPSADRTAADRPARQFSVLVAMPPTQDTARW